jgi:hypothetical protein
MKSIFLWLLLVATVAAQQQTGGITLRDGTDLPSAKIIAIGERSVTVMASGRIKNYPIEEVSEISLKNARERLANDEDKKKAVHDTAVKRDTELKAERDAEKKVAASNAVKKQQSKGSDASRKPSGKDPSKTLLELKARFPKQESKVLNLFNNQKNQNKKQIKIEVQIPHSDIYADYQGWIRTVTLDSIPQTLARLEERIQKNESAARKSDYDPNDSESVQARLSSEWVEKKLRPYLAELRALTKN